jgi:hypothetical protein
MMRPYFSGERLIKTIYISSSGLLQESSESDKPCSSLVLRSTNKTCGYKPSILQSNTLHLVAVNSYSWSRHSCHGQQINACFSCKRFQTSHKQTANPDLIIFVRGPGDSERFQSCLTGRLPRANHLFASSFASQRPDKLFYAVFTYCDLTRIARF